MVPHLKADNKTMKGEQVRSKEGNRFCVRNCKVATPKATTVKS